MKGPAIFLAQFIDESAPFNRLGSLFDWASALGYEGVQIPTSDPSIFDLSKAASSDVYCDEIKGFASDRGLQISELSTHLQGQLVAVHPSYNSLFSGFAPVSLSNNAGERTRWAIEQLKLAAKASERLGLNAHATFSGAFLWHTVYPWPQRPQGLVNAGFSELGKRWLPILDAFDRAGVDLCFELHPGEDLHDGVTFERFLDQVKQHPRANILYDPSHLYLQHMDYLGFIDCYHERIKAFHVKDAEYQKSPRSGVYGGYQEWLDRPGRFRSPGDGQIDFKGIFSRLTRCDFRGWPVIEWECCLKDSTQGAKEGAAFIRKHLIERSHKAFDDFASAGNDNKLINEVLGLDISNATTVGANNHDEY